MNKLLYKLEKKFGKYAIHNLMYYVIGLYTLGFVINIFSPQFYEDYLSLNAALILRGQVWRIFTYIIYPPSGSIIFILFALYLYYMIGKLLEAQWGAFRFNMYFLTGVLSHVIAAIVIYLVWGYVFELGTYYLNLSLFFAFATMYPNMQFLLFFIIPIKVKYLAIIDGIYFGVTILAGIFANYLPFSVIYSLYNVGIVASPANAVMAVVSFLNFLLYISTMRGMQRYTPKDIYRRKSFEKKMEPVKEKKKGPYHKCAVCGRTELDDPSLEFRYCSKCNGNYEYCQEHLFTHTHIQ